MKKVLIGYFTKTNTTKEYAEYIKTKLENSETMVDILPLNQIEKFEGYDFVVLGAPINGMMWPTEASSFVSEHADELKKLKIAIYFVSYMYNSCRKMWHDAIDKSMTKISEIVQPLFIGKFTGKVEKRFPRFFAWMFGIKNDLPLNIVNLALADEFISQIQKTLHT